MDSELSNNDQFSITNTVITNSSGLDILISSLTIQNTIRRLHEGVYTCVANNGIDNLIQTPESAEIFLIVQGIYINLFYLLLLLLLLLLQFHLVY